MESATEKGTVAKCSISGKSAELFHETASRGARGTSPEIAPKAISQQSQKRKSGIALIGDLPWGTHFCQFYTTKKDLLDALVPYFRAGLESNELCVWVTSDFLTKKDALEAMEKGAPGFSGYLSNGQIEIFPYTDWYLKGGNFDLQRTLNMWMEKHNEALSRGFAGMRVSGNPYWIDNKKDWDDFASYEAEINNVIGGTKLLVLCTYSLKKCGVSEIMDVVNNHEFALAMSQGEWQIVNMPGPCSHLQHS